MGSFAHLAFDCRRYASSRPCTSSSARRKMACSSEIAIPWRLLSWRLLFLSRAHPCWVGRAAAYCPRAHPQHRERAVADHGEALRILAEHDPAAPRRQRNASEAVAAMDSLNSAPPDDIRAARPSEARRPLPLRKAIVISPCAPVLARRPLRNCGAGVGLCLHCFGKQAGAVTNSWIVLPAGPRAKVGIVSDVCRCRP